MHPDDTEGERMSHIPVRRLTFGALVASSFIVSAVILSAADLKPDSIMGPIRTQWDTTRNYLVGIAEIIPESKYDFKPTPDVRTFREMLIHVIQENYLCSGF